MWLPQHIIGSRSGRWQSSHVCNFIINNPSSHNTEEFNDAYAYTHCSWHKPVIFGCFKCPNCTKPYITATCYMLPTPNNLRPLGRGRSWTESDFDFDSNRQKSRLMFFPFPTLLFLSCMIILLTHAETTVSYIFFWKKWVWTYILDLV